MTRGQIANIYLQILGNLIGGHYFPVLPSRLNRRNLFCSYPVNKKFNSDFEVFHSIIRSLKIIYQGNQPSGKMKFINGLFLGSLAVLSTAWSCADAKPLHFKMISRGEKAQIDSKLQQDRRRLYGERVGYRGYQGRFYGGSGSVHFLRSAEVQPMRYRITPAPTVMPSTSSAPSDTPRYVSECFLVPLAALNCPFCRVIY